MKIFCISDNTDTKTGLRLAGIDGITVRGEEEFNSALNGAVLDKEIGVLLITEKLAKEYRAQIDAIRLGQSLPLITEIPDRHGTGRSADFITEYVRGAIGLKI